MLTAFGTLLQNFKELGLVEPLQRALAAEKYLVPTPIQAQAIGPLLEGRDLLGCAQTGTGKTAAFALPVLQHLSKPVLQHLSKPVLQHLSKPVLQHLGESVSKPGRSNRGPQNKQNKRPIRAVVLSPTRELATQISESFETYGRHLPLQSMVIFGGVSEKPQIRALQKGVDIVVACPGRFLDLLGRGFIDLSAVERFVLDEADRMLDMGFINDIRRIMKQLPRQRQNLLFSATLPPSIVELANGMLQNPVRIEIAPETPTVEAIDQRIMYVDKSNKSRLIVDLLASAEVERSIVFTRTKHGANRLTKQLDKAGLPAIAIHGNKSQNMRQRALAGFRDGSFDVLVATDVASRGIDVDDITHVFNFDLPDDPESYVHRIGRTGRAGRTGIAISFCDTTEGQKLRDVEKIIGQAIPADEEHAYHCQAAVPVAKPRGGRGGGKRRNSGKSGRNRGRNRNRGRR